MSLLNRELDYFLTICETRNLARAAEALDVSQPALTRSLQRLEARFAAKLFVRAPRGVELTPIGAALRSRVEKARMTLNDAETEIAQLSAGKIGKVRVGAGPLWARLVSRSLFPRFIVERPAAQVQFHVAFNTELFTLVEGGRLDFAVCGLLDTPPPNLVFHALLGTGLVVIVRNGHPLSMLKKPTIRDLAKFRGAAPVTGMRARQIAEERFATLGIRSPPYAIETNSWEAMLDAVATTDFYSLAPRHAALWHGWASRLVAIEIPELDISQRIGVVTRADAYLSPLADRAIELIEQSLAANGPEDPQQKPQAKRVRAATV
jgi:DNA-binding transcriptional LysR family regulator